MSPSLRNSPSSIERGAAGLVFVVATALLAWFYQATVVTKHLDTVFLLQSIAGILEHGAPTSGVVTSWSEGARFFDLPPAQVCEAALRFVGEPLYNVLHNHAYLALYPIAAIAWIAGAEPTFAVLHAAAHLAVVLVAYLFLRRRGTGRIASIGFSVLLLAYPAWNLSADGQYYLDRIAMPFLLWLVVLLHARTEADAPPVSRGWTAAVFTAAIGAALCTERAAIMVLGSVVFFMLFYPALWRDPALRKVLAVVVALLVAGLALYFAFLFRGIEGGGHLVKSSTQSLDAIAAKLRTPAMQPFLVTNALFVGWLAVLAGWRPLLLALGSMLPNLVLGVGGAELVGWTTHYHAMYIPFLVFAAALGYSRLLSRVHRGVGAALAVVLAGCAVAVTTFYDPYTGKWSEANTAPSRHWGSLGAAWVYFVTPALSGPKATADWARTMVPLVPPGSSVSAVEGVMAALYPGRRVSLYPVGLDSAEYLVISGTAKDGVITSMSGAVSYLGAAQGAELNACLGRRAAAQGFRLYKEVPAISLLVFRKEPRAAGAAPRSP